MTAPTQGKERGVASAARGPFPPASSSPFPRSLPGASSSARPRAARPGEHGPLLPFLEARQPLPTLRQVGTSPCPDLALPPGPHLARLGAGAWLLWDAGTASLGAEGAGRRRTVHFQEPQPPSWAAPASGDPSQHGCQSVCSLGPGFHREPVGGGGTGGAGRRRPSGVPGAGRGRDPDPLGSGAGRRAPGEGPARKLRAWASSRPGGKRPPRTRSPGAIPGDPLRAQSQSPEGKPAEGRGLCVRARVRVAACELVQRR